MALSENEVQAVELLRHIKSDRGHGRLVIEIRDGIESLFDPTKRELPRDRPVKVR